MITRDVLIQSHVLNRGQNQGAIWLIGLGVTECISAFDICYFTFAIADDLHMVKYHISAEVYYWAF